MSANAKPVHTPVMEAEVVQALLPALSVPGAILVDGTVGLGGHAAALLSACPDSRLIGLDHDGQALALASERLASFGDRVELVRCRFDSLASVLDSRGVGSVNAVLLDLGLSSLQIDQESRGFAYSKDTPLDMRMDDRLVDSAATIVNGWSVEEMARIFADLGEEPRALRVAQAIVSARSLARITSTGRLVRIIEAAMPAAIRFGSGGHPAKRVFQALRMAVNSEREALVGVLPVALERLAVGGRMAVLSYHSGEDRLVKQAFVSGCRDQTPRRLPVVPESHLPGFRLVSKAKPLAAEISSNPRSASAHLRVVERIRK